MATSPRSSPSPPSGGDGSSPPPRGPPRSPPPPSSPPPPPPPRRSPPPPSSPPPPPPRRSPPPPPSSSPPPPPRRSPPSPSSPPLRSPPRSAPSKASPPPPPTNNSHKSHTHKTPHGSSSKTTSEAVIIGLVLAGLLILAFVIVCVACARRRKKKQKQRVEAYYMNPPRGLEFDKPFLPYPPPNSGDYYKNQWGGAGPPHDYVIKFKTPGMVVTPVGAGARWVASPRSSVSANSSLASASTVPMSNIPLSFSKSHFSYDELSAATDGFSQSNLLGQGGFGYVYKGVLPDGREVAVKSLKSGSTQGEREFQAEVEIISRVHHRHLVSLVGYCIADAQRMLVYEHVPNKALDFHLHGKGCPVMNWETRIRIALGSAKGLAYLHEDCHPRIIHRDIKSSNILLDHNFEAKVADFGLAKLASGEDTHISTRVMGTFGYLAPEYASSGKLTERSDVFSFGVVLLELLTGRKPIDPTSSQMEDSSLVEWAGPLLAKAFEDHNYDELVDPRLEGKYEADEVARVASCAAASIRHSAKRRPKMSQIVRALESSGSLDDVLKTRASSTLNSSQDMPTSVVYDTKAYNADMRKFKEMVDSSEEFTTN